MLGLGRLSTAVATSGCESYSRHILMTSHATVGVHSSVHELSEARPDICHGEAPTTPTVVY